MEIFFLNYLQFVVKFLSTNTKPMITRVTMRNFRFKHIQIKCTMSVPIVSASPLSLSHLGWHSFFIRYSGNSRCDGLIIARWRISTSKRWEFLEQSSFVFRVADSVHNWIIHWIGFSKQRSPNCEQWSDVTTFEYSSVVDYTVWCPVCNYFWFENEMKLLFSIL